MRNDFYNRFKKFVTENSLFGPEAKILLAVSGGVDSVTMASLFYRAGFSFSIAHCNFKLRGADSDNDEQFVKTLAECFGVPFRSRAFDVKKHQAETGFSVQMAARELRYAWFGELLHEEDFQYLAVAHHRDDFAETVILNLAKGSVLKGLHGILPKHGHIVRPLLWAGKDEILDYATQQKILYREDRSNAENKYQRNIVRNQLAPLLRQINPDLAQTVYRAAKRRLQLENFIEEQSARLKKLLLVENKNGFNVAIAELISNNISQELFYRWIESNGFVYDQIEDLFANLDGTETKVFYAGNSRLTKSGESVVFEKEIPGTFAEILIRENQPAVHCQGTKLSFSMLDSWVTENLKDPNIAFLDHAKIIFPLRLRVWRHGDSFRPFGLRGHKTVSDFLTDMKLPLQEKERQLVLLSQDEICWVVGKRIDDRFKVKEGTKKVLRIELA